ncbi:MAG: winged helix-turn-helix domain-containing protein [Candidatus Omnitrophica bacterium]|nr:winged helix-turn-helix domain-containing protein [Candidatus Omnitrophota bacterium]
MITEIGITAGDILHVLDKKSPVILKEVLKEIDAPHDLILMSLGWLAREGHVNVIKNGDDYTIKLV